MGEEAPPFPLSPLKPRPRPLFARACTILTQQVFGAWREPWPAASFCDGVRFYDELSAARGALGRFPGSQAMTVIKRFAGRSLMGLDNED